MRQPSYLVLSRHNIYYFRWPLPHKLRKQGKSAHIKLSLQTREPKEALRIAKNLVYHIEQLIQQQGFHIMDYATVKATIKQHLARVLENEKSAMSKEGAYSSEKLSKINNAIIRLEQEADGKWEDIYSLEEDYEERKYNQLTKFFSESELDSLSDKEKDQALRLVRLGFRDMWQAALEHHSSLDKFSFSSPSRSSKVAGPYIPTDERKLSYLIAKYVEERDKEKAWGNIRTKEERIACFNYLLEILGSEVEFSSLDVTQARFVKDVLLKTPVNRNKKKETRGKPWQEQIEVEGVKTLSVASVNKHLQCYSGLFSWAVDNSYVEVNPFTKLTLKDKRKRKDKNRFRFSKEEAQTIIAELQKKNSGLANSDMKYWGVMIGLYTGARLNEISSLTANDIKQDADTDIWYFDINDEEEKKRLKSEAAMRRVPVHSRLIELGLLEYVERVGKMKPDKNGDDRRLLYNLTYSEKEGWGRKLTRWFSKTFLPKLGLKRDGISFHSFRHTVVTLTRGAGVDKNNVAAFVGHEPEGVTDAVYNHGIGLIQSQKDIECLSYD